MAEEHPPDLTVDATRESPTAPPPPRYSRSHGRRNILIVVIVLLVLVGGLFLWRYLGSYESTDDAQVDDNQYVQRGAVLVEIDQKDYEVAIEAAKANLASAEATAQSMNIDVPITSANTSSQLKFTSSGVDNAGAGIANAENRVSAAHAQLEAAEANDVKAQDDIRRYKA